MSLRVQLLENLFEFDSEFDRFFQHLSYPLRSNQRLNLPITDLYETKDGYKVIMELPGFKKNDIKVDSDSECMEIRVSKDNNAINKFKAFLHLKERNNELIVGTICFPQHVEPSQAKVILEDGVLTITVPKAEQSQRLSLQVE